MTKAFTIAALAALCLGVAACASQKEPAEQAFAAVEAKFKESSAEIQKYLPELGEDATLFSLQTMVMAGALSAYSTPPPSLQAAYLAEPDLARFHLELKDSLKLALTATLLGVLPRR